MEHEYDISVEEKFRRDVNIMCNLSEGIEEKGMAKGIAKGEHELSHMVYFLSLYLLLISQNQSYYF